MRLLSWFFFVCLCVLPSPVAAQEGAIALSQIKQAMGGSRWDDVRTLHTKGKIQLGELNGSYEAWLDLRHLYSFTEARFSHLDLGEVRSVSGWNGSVAWTADQTGDVCAASSHGAIRDAANDAYVEAFGYLLNNASASLEVLRDANFQGRRFHVLKIAPAEGFPFELWTDPGTARVSRLVPLTGVERDATNYGDFRLVDGLLLPFRTEERDARSGKVLSLLTLSSIEIDQDPPEHRFDPPAALLSGLQFPAGSDSVHVPFRYEHGHIYLPVSINGRLFENFVFDTGMNNTMDTGTAKELGLKVVKSGTAWGAGTESVENGMTKAERLEIGPLKMENHVLDVSALNSSGERIAGGVGYQLAKRSVVTIDYSSHQITFTKPEAFRPPTGATRLPLRFASISEIVVDASVEGIGGEFQLDTGANDSLAINRPFAEQNGLLGKYGSGRKGKVSGVGGKAGIVLFKPSAFSMGGLAPTVDGAEIMLSKSGAGAEEYVAGTIGNQILRQYRVTLDYGQGAVYFEKDPKYRDDRDWTFTIPRPDLKKPGRAGDLGLIRLARRPVGDVEILGITAGPASRAGLKKGDWIVAINGVATGEMAIKKLVGQLLAQPGTALELTVRHGDVTREVGVTTR
jgi:hypothetical protein